MTARANGEIRPQGLYLVYHALNFIGKIFLFADCLCIIALGVYLAGMLCAIPPEEGDAIFEKSDFDKNSLESNGRRPTNYLEEI